MRPGVLIYRRGGLGDTLLTFPVAEAFKKLGYDVVFCGNEDYLILGKLCKWIDEIISSEFLEYAERITQRTFEKKVIISVNGNLKPFPEKRLHLPLYYLQSLGLPLFFSKRLPFGENLPRKENLAVLHPGSGSSKKNPPFELFERIESYLQKEGFKVLFLAGEAEDWLIGLKKNLFFSQDLLEIAYFLSEAALFVGNDSGISHLASYLGVKSFVFFGPSDEVIFRPIGEKVHLIKKELPCRPCFPWVCEERECLNQEDLFELFVRAFKNS